MWQGPWVGGVRGPLGPSRSSMAFAVRELHPTQHAGAAGRLQGSWGIGLCSDLQGAHPLPFQQMLGMADTDMAPWSS